MKNNKLIYGIGLILLAVAILYIGNDYSNDFSFNQKKTVNQFAADSIAIPAIQSLNSKANCRIEIIPSENEYVLFSYDQSKYKNNSSFSNNELTINFQSTKNINLDLNSSPKIKVKIYCKSLSKVLQTGVGDILNYDTLRAEQLIIQNKGVGDIKLTVNIAQETHVTNEGVGDIDLKGKTRFVKLENQGSGDIEADHLWANVAQVFNSGVGDVEVMATDSLYLKNKGIGDIEYSGPAIIVDIDSKGIGSINKK